MRNTLLGLVLVLSASGAVAATGGAAAQFLEQGGDPSMPWVSGGIGSDERAYMLSEYGPSYTLKLEFAVTNGSYLGDVDVVIAKPGGATLLTAHSRGPWFMTRIPAGDYRVKVSGYGRSFEQSVKVPARGLKTAVFNGWTEAGVSSAMRAAK
ncbi:hypothetical protein [Thiocystis violacea]|uniref:hypothetical protein n=1 Tax=Thiocystis violacea TaxID=13725 RepID=UPI0019050331|nr:hypothetical protein [Thiocystis violacea]